MFIRPLSILFELFCIFVKVPYTEAEKSKKTHDNYAVLTFFRPARAKFPPSRSGEETAEIENRGRKYSGARKSALRKQSFRIFAYRFFRRMIFHARMVSDTGRIRVNKCCICDSDPQTQTRLPRSQKRSAFLTTDRLSDIPGKKFTLEASVFSAFPMNSVLTHPGQSAVTVMPRSASSK